VDVGATLASPLFDGGRRKRRPYRGIVRRVRVNRFELTTLDEEIEKVRMRFEAAMFDAAHHGFQFIALGS